MEFFNLLSDHGQNISIYSLYETDVHPAVRKSHLSKSKTAPNLLTGQMHSIVDQYHQQRQASLQYQQQQLGFQRPDPHIFYSYWWCFLHLCLRCVRRIRLTPATSESFHPASLLNGEYENGKTFKTPLKRFFKKKTKIRKSFQRDEG